MFIDDSLTLDENIDYYITRYIETTNKEEKVLILEIIKKLCNEKELNHEL